MIFASGRFHAIESTYDTDFRVFSSFDGIRWAAALTGFHSTNGGLAAGPQGLFALGPGGVILHSPWDLVLSVPESVLNDTLRIQVIGPPGANVQLRRSATLTDWADWQTVTLNDAPVQAEDKDVAGSSQRFYRAVIR